LTDQITYITYFTDPLCCWSWPYDSELLKFRAKFSGKIQFKFCMGGLIPSWENFIDEINSVTKPAQMGPLWMHVSRILEVQINTLVWVKDPPFSSFPPCIAVKCAELQSTFFCEKYLNLLREAIMIRGINISHKHVLLNIASELSEQFPLFDAKKFETDFTGDTGINLFKKDIQKVKQYNILRFPSLLFQQENKKPMLIPGYRKFEFLEKQFLQFRDIIS
jgi:putative protein-disulfide isomerase